MIMGSFPVQAWEFQGHSIDFNFLPIERDCHQQDRSTKFS